MENLATTENKPIPKKIKMKMLDLSSITNWAQISQCVVGLIDATLWVTAFSLIKIFLMPTYPLTKMCGVCC